MESGTLRRPPSLPVLIQLGLVGGLLLLAGIAWGVTNEQMAGMDAGPGTDPGSLGFFLGVWVVMMAAMMFPSIAPMVLMFARIQDGRRERGAEVPAGLTALSVGDYLLVCAAAGLSTGRAFELCMKLFGETFSWENA